MRHTLILQIYIVERQGEYIQAKSGSALNIIALQAKLVLVRIRAEKHTIHLNSRPVQILIIRILSHDD